MEKLSPNYAKKIARLRYKDEIVKLSLQGMSIRKIEQIINYKLARTKIKTTLSKSLIHSIIKQYKGNLKCMKH